MPANATVVDIVPDLGCTIESYYSSLNNCTDLQAGIFASEDVRRFGSLLQFDVTGVVPSGAEVVSATLHMNRIGDYVPADGIDDQLSVYRVLDAWDDEVSWDTAPAFDDSVVEDTVVPQDGDNAWDVTRLVSAWADSSEAEYGLLVGDDPAKYVGDQRSLFWGVGSSPSVEPYIEVEYTTSPK